MSIAGAALKSDSIGLLAILCAAVLPSMFAVDGYAADVTFRWDYSQSGAAGFALYCGPSSRGYTTRTDVGNTDTFSTALPDGQISLCSVTAYEPGGAESAFSNELAISVHRDPVAVEVLPPNRVSAEGGQVTPTATGVRVAFTVPFDPRFLNLYASVPGLEGPPDVTLVGTTSGSVRGSLVLDDNNLGFTFIKTGGVLVPDTYVLTIASRDNGFVDELGRVLDGSGNGSGGDYRLAFVVAPTNTPILSIEKFARGPNQAVNLPPADQAAGIPVRIVNGTAVREVAFTLRYNPALLTVRDVSLPSSVTGTLTLKSIDQVAGLASIRVANLSRLTDASTVLLTLQADVPATATYGQQHILDLRDLVFNAGTLGGRADAGLHVVAYLGDTDADGRYSSFDALLIQRVIAGLDSGFSAYRLTDPVVVGDVNASGRLESTDGQLIQLKVLRRPVPEIP